jgi:hypothetical protein
MPGADQIYCYAERAVGGVIVELRPDLETRWRGVIPKNIGLDPDNWLVTSNRMVRSFNQIATGVPPVTMSEPARATYRSKALISLVTAIADLAEQAA